MKALDLLRADAAAFLATLDSTEPAYLALRKHANLVRALVDARPLTQRIDAAVSQVAAPLAQDEPSRKVVAQVRRHLEERMPWLSLAKMPDDKSIRRALQRLNQKNLRPFDPDFPHGSVSPAHTSTIGST
jgi:hypothetical protein